MSDNNNNNNNNNEKNVFVAANIETIRVIDGKNSHIVKVIKNGNNVTVVKYNGY